MTMTVLNTTACVIIDRVENQRQHANPTPNPVTCLTRIGPPGPLPTSSRAHGSRLRSRPSRRRILLEAVERHRLGREARGLTY